MRALPLVCLAAVVFVPNAGSAQPVTCRSAADRIAAATINEEYVPITTKYQLDTPPLQPILSTAVSVSAPSCLVATFSAVATPTDNYLVFQVVVNGTPMLGHTQVPFGPPLEPVVVESEESDRNQPRMISHQFFLPVAAGRHRIEVRAAAGSNIDPAAIPTITAPVLTVHYR